MIKPCAYEDTQGHRTYILLAYRTLLRECVLSQTDPWGLQISKTFHSSLYERVQKLTSSCMHAAARYIERSIMALSCLLLLLTLFMSLSFAGAHQTSNRTNYRDMVTGFVIFGDSTVDVGNNNFVLTPVRCNWEPYGRIFEGGLPTGRFCDGKLALDIVSKFDTLPPSVVLFSLL